MKVKMLNFAHPLTESNLQEIETLACCEVSEVIQVPSQIDPARHLEPQIACRLEDLGLTAQEWQSQLLLVNLPSLTCSAAVVLALLHGRMGYFPPVLRLRPETGNLVTRFVVAEIINLRAIRERGRGMR